MVRGIRGGARSGSFGLRLRNLGQEENGRNDRHRRVSRRLRLLSRRPLAPAQSVHRRSARGRKPGRTHFRAISRHKDTTRRSTARYHGAGRSRGRCRRTGWQCLQSSRTEAPRQPDIPGRELHHCDRAPDATTCRLDQQE